MGLFWTRRKHIDTPNGPRAATFQETRAGGTSIELFTRDRGPREFTIDLSINEIEDLLLAEDARRKV
jgi:hypothetical protein